MDEYYSNVSRRLQAYRNLQGLTRKQMGLQFILNQEIPLTERTFKSARLIKEYDDRLTAWELFPAEIREKLGTIVEVILEFIQDHEGKKQRINHKYPKTGQ